jgi:DNA polymerase (family X)
MKRQKVKRLLTFLVSRLGDATAVGSYRRGEEEIGDLDILVKMRDPSQLYGLIPKPARVLRQGSYIFTTVSPYDGSKGGDPIQVDIWAAEPKHYPYALLHYTGSKGHNIGMRRLAKSKGLKLNQYGLYRGETRIPASSEREIFALLGKVYKKPEERI